MFCIHVLFYISWCLEVTLLTFECLFQHLAIFASFIHIVSVSFSVPGVKVLAIVSSVASNFAVETSTTPSVPSFTLSVFTFSFF